jgi:hypothetical protein
VALACVMTRPKVMALSMKRATVVLCNSTHLNELFAEFTCKGLSFPCPCVDHRGTVAAPTVDPLMAGPPVQTRIADTFVDVHVAVATGYR